jgi:hypothetical protein
MVFHDAQPERRGVREPERVLRDRTAQEGRAQARVSSAVCLGDGAAGRRNAASLADSVRIGGGVGEGKGVRSRGERTSRASTGSKRNWPGKRRQEIEPRIGPDERAPVRITRSPTDAPARRSIPALGRLAAEVGYGRVKRREGCAVAPILRRAARGVYWFGLLAGPFFGTAVLVGSAFLAVRVLGVAPGILPFVFIGMGLVVWMSLIWAYRRLVPLPCIKCGRGAKATSLNPITIRCGSCGHLEVLETRVLGAP